MSLTLLLFRYDEDDGRMDLAVGVKEIKGHCPVHKVGDAFALKSGYRLVAEVPICIRSLASLLGRDLIEVATRNSSDHVAAAIHYGNRSDQPRSRAVPDSRFDCVIM
jgi:uncharacterized repeat protein (TIGR04076 family)